jgi:hypothetical protein
LFDFFDIFVFQAFELKKNVSCAIDDKNSDSEDSLNGTDSDDTESEKLN